MLKKIYKQNLWRPTLMVLIFAVFSFWKKNAFRWYLFSRIVNIKYFFKHSTDFQNQREKETKELLVNKSCFY